MRQVALLIVALALLVATPMTTAIPGDGNRIPNGADECSNSATATAPCLRVDVTNQNNAVVTRFYFYAAAAKCSPQVNTASPFGAACAGQPAQSQAIVVPPLGILGLLYQGTNGLDGLQRFAAGSTPADVMILI